MFKTLVFAAILIYPSMKCIDVCPHVVENGIYRGLGIFHRMIGFDVKQHKYVMFNRLGKEWEFEIKRIGNGFGIEMTDDLVKTYNTSNIVNRFATYNGVKWCSCELTSNPVKQNIFWYK